MPQFPGFPSNDFDFHFEEAGGALAGLLLRNRAGDVIPGVLPNTDTLLSAAEGWTLRVAPFVAARSKGRAVLLGGTTEDAYLEVDPAPAANTRLDVIYSLPADVGAGDPPRGVAVAKGTPSAVPAKPVIPVGAIELGTFRVTAGNVSAAAGVLTETFPFAALVGGLVYVRTRADLNKYDVMDGVRALVLADGSMPERVRGSWLNGRTGAYVAPFKAYSGAPSTISVEIEGGRVSVFGTATTTKPTELVGATNRLIGNIGERHGPTRQETRVMQGSGQSHWTLTVNPNGDVLAARYGPETPGTNVWLPFNIDYPIKRR